MPIALKYFLHRVQLMLLSTAMRFLPAPRPLILSGPGSALQLCRAMADMGARRVLVVTDAVLVKIGLVKPLLDELARCGLDCAVHDAILPDPTHAQVEAGIAAARAHHADTVLAVGGGSVMDAAKIVAACVANNVPVHDVIGNLKIRLAPLPIYCIPTTAGTGSEVTVVAVVTDEKARAKTPVVDGKLVPVMAALDGSLMTGVPAPITAATGMDALTHAVESYISTRATPATMRLATAAVRLVFGNLATACERGSDLEARQAMAVASNYAGLAFTQTSVGYVHAIAHNLGGLYHTPHGLANAIVLPHILDYSRDACVPQLAELARCIGESGADDASLADRFIARVRELSRRIGVPERLDALRAADIPELARRAMAEAQGFYPVPRFMGQAQCEAILHKLLP
jgi:alcohol dehydrogenase